jgi:pimeloyl-ACP methyl ester carboxylesterase
LVRGPARKYAGADRLRPALVGLLLIAALALVAPGDLAAGATIRSRSCPAGLPAPWRCAVVNVALDRRGRVPGRVHLAVALLHQPGPPRPAVLALSGGPGGAAVPRAVYFKSLLAPLLAGRDLLVIDQRGVGASDPISCPAIDAEPTWSASDVARCAAQLGPQRAFYRTADSVADLDAVRRALKIPRLTVYGVSYGTKVAIDYAWRHPNVVDRLVLDSPIVEDTDPFYRRSAVGAARVLANQCGEGACPAGVDPVADLTTLVKRMKDGVLPGHPAVAEGPLLNAIVKGGPPILHKLPAALHAAVAGRFWALTSLLPPRIPDARSPDWLSSFGSHTIYLATSCEDGDFPWKRSDTLAQRLAAVNRQLSRLGDAAFAPFDHYVGAQYGEARICEPWPNSGRRSTPPRLPNVPALLLVGGDDDLAPLEGAREIAAQLPQARIVTVPSVGHGVLGTSGPGASALRAFAAST